MVSVTTVKTKAELWSDCLMPCAWPSSVSPAFVCFSLRPHPLNHSIVVDTIDHCWITLDRPSANIRTLNDWSDLRLVDGRFVPSHIKHSKTCAKTHSTQLQTFCSQVHICFLLAVCSFKWAENEEPLVYQEKQQVKRMRRKKTKRKCRLIGILDGSSRQSSICWPLPRAHVDSSDDRIMMLKYSRLMMYSSLKPSLIVQPQKASESANERNILIKCYKLHMFYIKTMRC